jgi:hypothetical protein
MRRQRYIFTLCNTTLGTATVCTTPAYSATLGVMDTGRVGGPLAVADDPAGQAPYPEDGHGRSSAAAT